METRQDGLFRAVGPNLYRMNAFRIAGLPIDASPQQITRQGDKIRMAEKFGGGVRFSAPLPLIPPPNAEEVRTALQKLQDPDARLIEEFFWFWPQQQADGGEDEAMAALTGGDQGGAAEMWRRGEIRQPPCPIAIHNLAVLPHLLVLDLELSTHTAIIPAEEIASRTQLWRFAFERWKALINNVDFWGRLAARIREMDDPRLTPGMARQMRESLPLALLSINSQLAARAAQAGNFDEAGRHIRLMQESGFFVDVVQEALRESVEPIRERLKALCEVASLDADNDIGHADAVVRRLLEQSRPLLDAMDCLLPVGDSTRDGAHDEVALRALVEQIAFGNKTKDWRTSAELMSSILPVAGSASAKSRIEDNLRIVRENLQLSTCFFCERQPTDEKSELSVKMHGNVKTSYIENRTTWSHNTFTVPRCERCVNYHQEQASAGAMAGLIAFISVAVLLFSLLWVGPLVEGGAAIMLYLAGLLAAVGVPLLLGRGANYILRQLAAPEDRMYDYPTILERLRDGWKFGEDPPGFVPVRTNPAAGGLFGRSAFLRRRIENRNSVFESIALSWSPALLILLILPPLVGLALGGVGPTLFLAAKGRLTDKQIVERLVNEFADPSSTSLRAFDAIAGTPHLNQQLAIFAFGRALESPNREVRWKAIEKLGDMGADAIAAIPALRRIADDSNNPAAGGAKKALLKISPGSVVEDLEAKLNGNPAESVRLSAAEDLRNLGPTARGAIGTLKRARKDSDIRVREMAAEALNAIDPKLYPLRVRASVESSSASGQSASTSNDANESVINNTSGVSTRQIPRMDSGRVNSLQLEITGDKLRLSGLSISIIQCRGQIDFYKNGIERDRQRLNQLESNSRLGLAVEQWEYEQVRSRHNSNVEMYNNQVNTCRNIAQEHDSVVESINAKVREYNRLISQ